MDPYRNFLVVALVAGLAVAGAWVAWAQIPRTPSPPGARVYFIEPKDGALIKGPVKVVMGLAGMGIAPAGVETPDPKEQGHHHLLVNTELKAKDQPIPSDDRHRHFGKGQTETVVDLPTGKHTLHLVLGDRYHVPHDPPVMSEKITISVEK